MTVKNRSLSVTVRLQLQYTFREKASHEKINIEKEMQLLEAEVNERGIVKIN